MEAGMLRHTSPPGTDTDANFIGWQKKISGEIFPLFNITRKGHPLYQSTVGEDTLRREHLRVPQTRPPYPEVRPSPWHKLGIELNNPKTARDAITMAGLDYTVMRKARKVNPEVKEYTYATVRTDTDEVLGFVDVNCKPIQNIYAFKFFDALVAQDEAKYETAGVLGRGELVWILARLQGHIMVNGNDIVNKYLLLTNSHDGSSYIRVRVTPIRAVCNNTLTSALQGAGEVQINHPKNVGQDGEQAAAILGVANSLYENLDLTFNSMANKKINEVQLRNYVQALVPDNEEAENTARTENIRISVLRLHEEGHGAKLARGTVWGAFNSVAEYTDHMMSVEDSATRLNSIWFGRGEQLKAKAFRLAQQMMNA
jgi:phage/plasmid-like protein (TIGR03299 family)